MFDSINKKRREIDLDGTDCPHPLGTHGLPKTTTKPDPNVIPELHQRDTKAARNGAKEKQWQV